MSIKNLFKSQAKSIKSANSSSSGIESNDYSLAFEERNEQFVPFIDFSSASNFARFGSAEEYYKDSIERIHGDYPYDGSLKEKILFELSCSYLDKYILNQRYPKTNGHIKLSYGGWGSQTSTADGFGLSDSNEFIYVRGGVHTYDETKNLSKIFDKSIKYDEANKRTSGLKLKPSDGVTVEFWLKKDSFSTAKTEKEVILDLWNNQPSSSADYGRFTLVLSGTTSGVGTFIATMQSGTTGFYEQPLGTSTITTSSLSNWHHYALSFVSESSGVMSRIYVDGDLNKSSSLGSSGINEIGGLINGYIGALQTSPSGSTAAQYSGKLSASLDEFRFWKKRRTSEEIYNNWYQPIGGGTNTDTANVYLGFYYKFNEGIVGDVATDAKILDYSGRLVNGAWTGYQSGARSTESGMVLSGLVPSEEKDPIIYSTHPDVSSLKATLMSEGKRHDNENNGMLYHKVPGWIQREDQENGYATKKLYQIISSYFDNLYQQITFLPHLKNKVYPSSSYKPLPFADRLLEDKGMFVSNLFGNSNVLEYFSNRDVNKVQFESKIHDLKNQIYTNIYNNLENIYKEKGTEGGIRNMLRCFGVDDELVKLNIYTDKGTHYFSDAFKQTNVKKKFINFNTADNLTSTIFQTSSLNHSLTYLSGSESEKKERYNAITSEVSLIVPKKLRHGDPGYFISSFISASIFGVHQATTSSADYTWASNDLANFQVFIVKDNVNPTAAKFVLEDSGGNISLESDFYKDIYSNESWNIAVRIKPEDYPIAGNVVTSSNRNYTLEFYGVSHAFDTVKEEFILTKTLNYETGSSYLSNSKRFYVGAHRQNFTGSVLQNSDIQIGRFNVWYDYLSNNSIKLHNKDITSKSTERSFRPSTIFGQDLSQTQVPSNELLTIDWDFETVTTSDSSGKFIVEDASSGSVDSRYGWMDNIIRREHRAVGFGFPASSTSVIRNTIVNSSKKELPEISYSSDRVRIMDDQNNFFIEDEDVSDNFYALEKSMYQTISEEMMRTLSTAQVMSNLIGEAVERYRIEYKKLNHVRRVFFEDVEEEPDFDKFTEYFKWIDSSVSSMITQLFPVSVRYSKGISDVVESHLFERNKYQNKFPLISTHTSTEGRIIGVGQTRYPWKFGHAPLSGDDNDNCLWQKERAERSDVAERETIRQIIGNRNNAQPTTLGKSDRTSYLGSTFATRRFSKAIQLNASVSQVLHAGTNYNLQKDRNYVWSATNRHSRLNSVGVPVNVMIVGAGTGQGIELPRECNDVENPNQKKKFNSTVFIGKESGGGEGGSFSPINDSASYSHALKGHQRFPFNFVSGNITTGYNSAIASGYKSDVVLTNLHSDTTDYCNDIPLQGPFTQQWVGGHQSRHIDLNRYDKLLIDGQTLSAPTNNIQNQYTRPEGWRLLVVEFGGSSDGALGIVDAQYGITSISGHPNNGKYPDAAKKAATLYREGRAKRPLNISNIQTTTSSINHGNYRENYEVISSTGKKHNNLFFRKNSDSFNFLPSKISNMLSETTNYQSLAATTTGNDGNVFGVANNNRQKDLNVPTSYTKSNSNSVIVSRFSAPGGIEVQSHGYLDAYSQEYSVHNNLNYRNLSVRGVSTRVSASSNGSKYFNFGGSGELGTIRSATHLSFPNTPSLQKRDNMKALLSRHCFKFGIDSRYVEELPIIPGEKARGRFVVRNHARATDTETITLGNGTLQRVLEIETGGGVTGTNLAVSPASNEGDFWNNIRARLTTAGYDSTYAVQSFSPDKNLFEGHYSAAGPGLSASNPDIFALEQITYVYKLYSSSSYSGVSKDASLLRIIDEQSFNSQSHNKRAYFDAASENLLVSTFARHAGGSPQEFRKQYNNFWTGREDQWITLALVFNTVSGASMQSDDINVYVNGITVGTPTSTITANLNHFQIKYEDPRSDQAYILSHSASNAQGQRFKNLHVSEVAVYNKAFSAAEALQHYSHSLNYDFSHAWMHNYAVAWYRMGNGSGDEVTGDNSGLNPGHVRIVNQAGSGELFFSTNVQRARLLGSVRNANDTQKDYAIFELTSSANGAGYNDLIMGNLNDNSNTFSDQIYGTSSNSNQHSLYFYEPLAGGIDDRLPPSIDSSSYDTQPSFHKQQRNENRRPSDLSMIPFPVLITRHDNAYVNSPIPRSDFQYNWVTSSLGSNYSITSGKQRMYGYAHPSGIMSSSAVVDGDSGFVPAITFPTASEIFGV